MFGKKHCAFFGIALALVLAAGCGSDSTTSTTTTADTTGFPSGLAVASGFSASSSTARVGRLVNGDVGTVLEAFDSTQTFEEKTEELETVVAAATDAACQVTLPDLNQSIVSPDCYGPNLDYQDHPDASSADGNQTCDDADDQNEDDGFLPSGDLGIWTSAESGNACAAAKINQLINSAALKADTATLLAASVRCLMTRSGTDEPEAGSSVDLTTSLATAIAENNSDVTVTEATFERLTDSDDGYAIYKYTIKTTEDSGNVSSEYYLKHMETATDNSTFKGKFWGSVEGFNTGTGDSYAFSLLYEKASSTSLNYVLDGSSYNATEGDAHPADHFATGATEGTLDFTNDDFSSNLEALIVNMDPSTSLGTFAYAWNAGGNDDSSRMFQAYTSASGTDVTGCAFFNFGENFDSGRPTFGDTNKFICNWAGPGNSHTGLSGTAQKQCMTQGSDGSFTVTSEAITYAPVNSCDFNGSGTFNFGLTGTTSGPATCSDWGDNFTTGSGYGSAITNDLVTLSSDSDWENYTAPTAPTDSF